MKIFLQTNFLCDVIRWGKVINAPIDDFRWSACLLLKKELESMMDLIFLIMWRTAPIGRKFLILAWQISFLFVYFWFSANFRRCTLVPLSLLGVNGRGWNNLYKVLDKKGCELFKCIIEYSPMSQYSRERRMKDD